MLLKTTPKEIYKSILEKLYGINKEQDTLTSNVITVTEIQHNDKVFDNSKEQLAFLQYHSATKIKDPITKESILTQEHIRMLVRTCDTIETFYNKLSNLLLSPNYLDPIKLSKVMSSSMSDVNKMKQDNPDIILWKSLTSCLRNDKMKGI